MAITKMMHMKASSKARIDIHLEHSINYILQPKKLGEANLAGSINCLPEMAYRQMKASMAAELNSAARVDDIFGPVSYTVVVNDGFCDMFD